MTTERNIVVDTLRGMDLHPGVEISPTGLKLPARLPYPIYEDLMKHLFWIKDRAQAAYETSLWLIGDALAYGEYTYGSKYQQAVELWDRSESRLRTVNWVASNVPPERRHPRLSFEHHAEVAALPPAQQQELLDKAEQYGWSKTDVRREKKLLNSDDAEVEQYHWTEAEQALNRAADLVAALPVGKWVQGIMGILVKPLRHETNRVHYREFVEELYQAVSRLRDTT